MVNGYANHKKIVQLQQAQKKHRTSKRNLETEGNRKETNIICEIFGKYKSYDVNTKRSLLCLNEKLRITLHNGDKLLNKRTEVISKCIFYLRYNSRL